MIKLNEFLDKFMGDEFFVDEYPSKSMRKNVLKNTYHAIQQGDTRAGIGVITQKDKLSPKDLNVAERTVEGHFVKWDTLNSHREVVRRGAFEKAIKEFNSEANTRVVKLLYDHNRRGDVNDIIGVVNDLSVDDYGVKFRATLHNDTKDIEVLKNRIRSGDMELSYGFIPGETEIKGDEDDYYLEMRSIDRIIEVSILSSGSDRYTNVQFVKAEETADNRSMDNANETDEDKDIRELKRILNKN